MIPGSARTASRRSRAGCAAALLLFALVGFGLHKLGFPWRPEPDEVRLVRVADGDTVVLSNSRGLRITVRLIGVDAPELGTAASFRSALFAADLCEQAKHIAVEPEPTRPKDKYGRTLGWVWLTMPDGRRVLLNEEMIRSGNAQLFEPTSKSVKYYRRLRK